MSTVLEIERLNGSYFLTCQPNCVSITRVKPLMETVKIKPLTQVLTYPRMLLFCITDAFDGDYFYTRASVMDKARELAQEEKGPNYSTPLPNLDFQIVSASYFGETILSTIDNKEPFAEIIVKFYKTERQTEPQYNLYRIYLESRAIIGIEQIGDHNFLTGNYFPGFADMLDKVYVEPFYGDRVKVKNQMTTTNSLLNRTVYRLEGSDVMFVVLEWRAVLHVHQYYYEIYAQCEYTETDLGDKDNLFETLFSKISDFSSAIVERHHFGKVVKISTQYRATSGRLNYSSDINLAKYPLPNFERRPLSQLFSNHIETKPNYLIEVTYPVLDSSSPKEVEPVIKTQRQLIKMSTKLIDYSKVLPKVDTNRQKTRYR